MAHITLTIDEQRLHDQEAISIEQFLRRRVQRRRRVAKRLAKRFPLFAVEMMQNEFPGYTYDEFVADVTRKTRKGKSFRRPKSPMVRCGRWGLFRKAMQQYGITGDRKFLEEAQTLRNRMYLPIELLFSFRGERMMYRFHCETPLSLIQDIQKITGYSSWEELEQMVRDRTRYTQCHYSTYPVTHPPTI